MSTGGSSLGTQSTSMRAVSWLVLVRNILITHMSRYIMSIELTGLMCVGLNGLMIGSSDRKKKAFLKSSQTLSWTSFIEAVTADGRKLKPGIIFKGKNLQTQWFLKEFEKFADWYYITSDNGTLDIVGLQMSICLKPSLPMSLSKTYHFGWAWKSCIG